MSNASNRSGVVHLGEARKRLPGPAGEHSVTVLRRGTLDARLALSPAESPTRITRHDHDEVYAVVRGRGVFFHDGRRDPFEAGDLLHVAAGIGHRFEEFTNDLAVWVVFYGPAGGEIPVRA